MHEPSSRRRSASSACCSRSWSGRWTPDQLRAGHGRAPLARPPQARPRDASRRSSATPPTTPCCATRCWRTSTASSSTRWKRRPPTSSCSQEFGTTHDELAGRIGRSRSQITNTIRLLNLPVAGAAPGRRRCAVRRPRPRAARPSTTRTPQDELAARIVAEGLSVRAIEELVALGGTDDADRAAAAPSADHRAWRSPSSASGSPTRSTRGSRSSSAGARDGSWSSSPRSTTSSASWR